MPTLETLLKPIDKMSEAELKEYIRQVREQRKIKKRVKKEHTIKGKRKTNTDIKKRYAKMTDQEKADLIKILKGG